MLTEPVIADGRERPPWTTDELRFLPGVSTAVAELREAGFLLVAVTNQPDIGRGTAQASVVATINDLVSTTLDLDALFMCPHDGIAGCDCRKPLPGMLLDAARALDIDLPGSWLIGDRWVNIAAGRAAGVRTVLLERPGSWHATSAVVAATDLRGDAIVSDLPSGVRTILAGPGHPGAASIEPRAAEQRSVSGSDGAPGGAPPLRRPGRRRWFGSRQARCGGWPATDARTTRSGLGNHPTCGIRTSGLCRAFIKTNPTRARGGDLDSDLNRDHEWAMRQLNKDKGRDR